MGSNRWLDLKPMSDLLIVLPILCPPNTYSETDKPSETNEMEEIDNAL